MKKFINQLFAIAATLGLAAKLKGHELSEEEQASLKKEYDAKFGENAFENDMKAYDESLAKQKEDFIYQQIAEALGQKDVQSATLESIVTAISELKETVKALGAKASEDEPETHVSIADLGVHTKDFAFGVKNDIFAASKRHNAIAISGRLPEAVASEDDVTALKKDVNAYAASLAKRYQQLCKSGRIATLAKGADFSHLSQIDLNERYYDIRQDMLISRILALPNLSALFPTVSNVQSGQIFTSLLAKAVSQAYQKGRVFKGGVSFEPEKAYTDKVMAKIQFDDMTELETNYLNYLNTNGSDPVKWSMIEWIILELATQISSERNERAVMGYRIEPVANTPGHELHASTGIVYRLLGYYYKEHKVLPFKAAALRTYDETNIGDVLQAFAAELQRAYKRPKDLVIYLNEGHKPMFSAWLNAKYGKNTGMVPAPDTVPNYGYAIKWVPNMPLSLYFIFATIDRNIVLLENVPGEEFDMKFQRDLEEVIAFSYWKEGAAAGFAGVKEDNLAALEAAGYKDRQIIFMNLPVVALAAGATTADANDGFLFLTGANAAATALTDIENAEEGVVYHIEIGTAANATTIAKSGKFSEIKSAWNPTAAGEWIDVYYDAENEKFLEAARG